MDQNSIKPPLNLNDVCPYCKRAVSFNTVFSDKDTDGLLFVFRCPRPHCHHLFAVRWREGLSTTFPAIADTNEIPDKISKISSNFYEIYQQANIAEHMGLDKICGMGYRRAAEYLVKDFLLYIRVTGKTKEQIYKMSFASAISALPSQELKDIAKASSWLGNDETHTFRIWLDMSTEDLKAYIKSLASFIMFKANAEKAKTMIDSKDKP